LPAPTDEHWHIKPPSPLFYDTCSNNFWWSLNNAAKGLARDELPYVMNMLNHYVRDMLNKSVEWYIGIRTGFSVSAGKAGRYFRRHLPPELYARYAETYCGSDYADIWAVIDIMSDLFHEVALSVAAHLKFAYRQNEEDGIRNYLQMVKVGIL
jgi:aminoglycoside 6-adenylyltransferase